jgi:hypothetical protein
MTVKSNMKQWLKLLFAIFVATGLMCAVSVLACRLADSLFQ